MNLTEEQIQKMTLVKYPYRAKERSCRSYRCRMEGLREAYRNRLINEQIAAIKMGKGVREDQPQV